MSNVIRTVPSTKIHVLIVWPDDFDRHPTIQGFMVKVEYAGQNAIGGHPKNDVFVKDNHIVNLWSATAEGLFGLIKENFPHLQYKGNPIDIDSGEVFDAWHLFTDPIGDDYIVDQESELGYKLSQP